MSSKRRKKIPNTAIEFLRNKSHLENLVTANNISHDWYSPLFTLDVVDDYLSKVASVSPTYFDNKVILNREGLLVFIKTQLPQGFEQQFMSKSKYGAQYIDNLLLELTFSIIFDKSYRTCSGQIGKTYASVAFENMRNHLEMFDIAVILELERKKKN